MIERLARRPGARGQFRFAAEAKALVPPREDFLLAKSHRGLHLLAAEADALRMPAGVLEAAYGRQVVIEPRAAGEAVMDVRVGIERMHLARVELALRRRDLNPSVEYGGAHYCVLRFGARPRQLLGLPVELEGLTDGRCTQQVLLTAYR